MKFLLGCLILLGLVGSQAAQGARPASEVEMHAVNAAIAYLNTRGVVTDSAIQVEILTTDETNAIPKPSFLTGGAYATVRGDKIQFSPDAGNDLRRAGKLFLLKGKNRTRNYWACGYGCVYVFSTIIHELVHYHRLRHVPWATWNEQWEEGLATQIEQEHVCRFIRTVVKLRTCYKSDAPEDYIPSMIRVRNYTNSKAAVVGMSGLNYRLGLIKNAHAPKETEW